MSDATLLLHQELALAKYELYEEARKTKSAVVSLASGIGIGAIGGLLLIIMLVHLLRALTEWPLWVCYGIIGGICLGGGGAMLYSARKQMSEIELIPQDTIKSLKENVQWLKRKAALKKI
jgi:hypothetical protein